MKVLGQTAARKKVNVSNFESIKIMPLTLPAVKA